MSRGFHFWARQLRSIRHIRIWNMTTAITTDWSQKPISSLGTTMREGSATVPSKIAIRWHSSIWHRHTPNLDSRTRQHSSVATPSGDSSSTKHTRGESSSGISSTWLSTTKAIILTVRQSICCWWGSACCQKAKRRKHMPICILLWATCSMIFWVSVLGRLGTDKSSNQMLTTLSAKKYFNWRESTSSSHDLTSLGI